MKSPTSSAEVVISYRWVRTPGGRGRNAGRWEATWCGWINAHRGRSEAEAVGKSLLSHYRSGEKPAVIVTKYEAWLEAKESFT